MGGGKGSAPDSPDYVGAAAEQGLQNRLTFLEGLNATRINQVGPYGSQIWEYNAPQASKTPRPEYSTYADKIG